MGDGHVYSNTVAAWSIFGVATSGWQKVRERLAEAEAQLRAKDGVCSF